MFCSPLFNRKLNATLNLRNAAFFTRDLYSPSHSTIGAASPCCKEYDIFKRSLTSFPQSGAKRKAAKGKQPKITPTTAKDTPLS